MCSALRFCLSVYLDLSPRGMGWLLYRSKQVPPALSQCERGYWFCRASLAGPSRFASRRDALRLFLGEDLTGSSTLFRVLDVHAHQRVAFAKLAFILLSFVFGNAGADKRARETTDGPAGRHT